MPNTSAHLKKFSESVIGEMTRMAEDYGAISLSSGFPDFDPPPELLAAAEVALHSGFNQYATIWGSQRFRQALARKQSHFMGLNIDPDVHITVTCGSTEAMMVTMLTICNPGDKVIVFSPFYENYTVDIILSGAQPIFVSLEPLVTLPRSRSSV